ncbi:hypothetical protein Ahy_B08g093377 [Arachis hypogaea]|uniref:Uncharacterized protein n=1 Tax=Arachis hypogaea TaxID=3818 RepID=A0A444Y5Y9_ARAHY|nr:hypothetical protein Ahy_B08g093377 [Arachis hypogaea]
MYREHHTLIIYDDPSKQAQSYRQMSLLLKRPQVAKLIWEMFFICIHVFWKEPLNI